MENTLQGFAKLINTLNNEETQKVTETKIYEIKTEKEEFKLFVIYIICLI